MEQQSSAPPQARALVDFLRSSSTGPKTKVGVLNGQRRDYFRGSGAVKSLLSPAYQKLANAKPQLYPKVTNDDDAEKVLHAVIPFAFFLRVDRADAQSGKEKMLQINQMQMFKQDMFFVWLYEGSQLLLKLSGLGMIALMLAAVMFPLWPSSLRVGVWYLSMACLGLIAAFFGLAVVRLILWAITKLVLSPGIWLFPNLFEDVGFVDSFIPLWAWDVPPPKKARKSAGVGAGAGGAKRVKSSGAAANGGGGDDGVSGPQTAVANLPGGASGPAEVKTNGAPPAAATTATGAAAASGGAAAAAAGGGGGGAARQTASTAGAPARRSERLADLD